MVAFYHLITKTLVEMGQFKITLVHKIVQIIMILKNIFCQVKKINFIEKIMVTIITANQEIIWVMELITILII